jgi:hypothetical protein
MHEFLIMKFQTNFRVLYDWHVGNFEMIENLISNFAKEE